MDPVEHTLSDGYKVHYHPDTGRVVLQPGQSRLRKRLTEAHGENLKAHQELAERHRELVKRRRESLAAHPIVPHSKRVV
jgi:hypothetical protein